LALAEGLGQARAKDAPQLLLREARELPQQKPLDPVPQPAPEHRHDREADRDSGDGLPVELVALERGAAVATGDDEVQPGRVRPAVSARERRK
jgi:hypothetical protein